MSKSTANAEMKILAEQFDLAMSAFHESGHAICGLLHSFKVDAIHIFHNPKRKRIEGFVLYDDKDQPNQKWLHSDFCISYAGMVAETILYQRVFGVKDLPMVLKGESSSDIYAVGQLMQKHRIGKPGKQRSRLKKKIIQKTTKDLTKYWEDITLIAHALIQERHLYFPDLRKLLLKSSKNKSFWKKQLQKII